MFSRGNIFLSFLFSALLLSSSSVQQKIQWQGKTYEEDQVTVLKNPQEPLYGEISLELEVDLIIGDENEFPFYNRGIHADVDSHGNIFILDIEKCCVFSFNKEGKYMNSFGKRGQGPGEFERPLLLYLDPEDLIYVNEIYEIDVFNSAGEYIRSIKSQDFIAYQFRVTLNGNIFAERPSFSSTNKTLDFILYDSVGNLIKKVCSFPSKRQPRIPGIEIQTLIFPMLWSGTLNEELSFYGYSDSYRFYIIDQQGETVRIIEKDEKPVPITKSLRKEFLNDLEIGYKEQGVSSDKIKWALDRVKSELEFPEHMPYYYKVLADDKGRIYVQKIDSVFNKNELESFDLFNSIGYYLYKVKIPLRPSLIRNGYLYKIKHEEETGYKKFIRYKITNWNEIKN